MAGHQRSGSRAGDAQAIGVTRPASFLLSLCRGRNGSLASRRRPSSAGTGRAGVALAAPTARPHGRTHNDLCRGEYDITVLQADQLPQGPAGETMLRARPDAATRENARDGTLWWRARTVTHAPHGDGAERGRRQVYVARVLVHEESQRMRQHEIPERRRGLSAHLGTDTGDLEADTHVGLF